MEYSSKNSRMICPFIDIWNYFADRKYTYKEIEEILNMLSNKCVQDRREIEYDTTNDFINDCKSNDCSEMVVSKLCHVEMKF